MRCRLRWKCCLAMTKAVECFKTQREMSSPRFSYRSIESSSRLGIDRLDALISLKNKIKKLKMDRISSNITAWKAYLKLNLINRFWTLTTRSGSLMLITPIYSRLLEGSSWSLPLEMTLDTPLIIRETGKQDRYKWRRLTLSGILFLTYLLRCWDSCRKINRINRSIEMAMIVKGKDRFTLRVYKEPKVVVLWETEKVTGSYLVLKMLYIQASKPSSAHKNPL
jgi:hypothetical protein